VPFKHKKQVLNTLELVFFAFPIAPKNLLVELKFSLFFAKFKGIVVYP